MEWSGTEALATADSSARKALDWLLDKDPFNLTSSNNTSVLDIQQRYISAVFYFATVGEHWSARSRRRRRRRRKMQHQQHHEDLHNNLENNHISNERNSSGSAAAANFLTNRDVCLWTTSNGKSGILCDDNGFIVELSFRKLQLPTYK